jgi:16S rRNA (guanine527-N7)-methyltransferase
VVGDDPREPIVSEDSLEELLEAGLAELGRAPAPGQLEKLAQLARLLAHWSTRFNLTAHPDASSIARRLILDAAALLAALPAFESAADLGSGAGFPGLPFAILEPERRVILVDSRRRRHHFQREAIRTLSLPNVESVHGRLESLQPTASSAVIAQALAKPEKVLAWMVEWAEPGGLLAIPGGERAPDPGPLRNVRTLEQTTYQVPLNGPRRTLWMGRCTRS